MTTYGRQPGGGSGYPSDRDRDYREPAYGQPVHGQPSYGEPAYGQPGPRGPRQGGPHPVPTARPRGSEYGVYGAAAAPVVEEVGHRARPASGSSGRTSSGNRPPTKGGRGTTGKGGGRRPKRVKAKSPWWAKLTITLGALVMVAAGAGIVGVQSLLGQVDKSVNTVSLLDNGTGAVQSISGAINILMIGLDTRDDNPGLGSRADSIIIGHVPASHDSVQLMSIPRDTWVPIPADPKHRYLGTDGDKINGAFLFGSQNGGGLPGGVQLLQKTIQQNWGLTFQAALIVNFDGFRDIVNKLGGVTMYIDETTKSLHHGYKNNDPNQHASPFIIHSDGTPGPAIYGVKPVIYEKGTRHLSAYDALDYVRCRDWLPNTDYDRQRHQQQFIKALLEEAYHKGISDPTHISGFLDSLKNAFTFDPGKGHKTSEWVVTLKGISPSNMMTLKTNNGTYNTVYVQRGGRQISTERLSDTSVQLIEDIKADKVQDFITQHPDWVTDSR